MKNEEWREPSIIHSKHCRRNRWLSCNHAFFAYFPEFHSKCIPFHDSILAIQPCL
jgi:hypothetical protein